MLFPGQIFFTPGNTSELKINLPPDGLGEATDEPEDSGEASSDMDPEMMKAFYEGMSISLYLDIDGEIVSTNATTVEGSRISLLEIDFDKILANPEVFEKLMTNEMETIEQMKSVVSAVPGLAMELNDTVSVVFR